jgi:hypothetical protein
VLSDVVYCLDGLTPSRKRQIPSSADFSLKLLEVNASG